MIKIPKAKLNKDIRVNFNTSSEIAYWANKLQISAELLEKKFQQTGYSIHRTILYFTQNNKETDIQAGI